MMARGLALCILGVIVGAVVARLVTRAMQPLLYEVSAGDMATYIAVLALLATVAIAACAVPSLRAARVDPMGLAGTMTSPMLNAKCSMPKPH